MASGSLTHWITVNSTPIKSIGIIHSSGSIIHGTGKHPDEGNSHIVFGKIIILSPFYLLESKHTLVGKDVGISTMKAGRFIGTMKQDKLLIRCSLFSYVIEKIDHLLIV